MQSRHLNRAVTELEHSLAMAPEQTRLFRQSSTKTTYDGVRVCMSCQVAGWTHGRTDGILPDACGRHVRVFPSLSLSVGVACLGRRGAFSPSHQRPARLACRVSFRARARSLASAFPLANSQPVTNKVQHMTDRPVCTSTVTGTSNCAVAQPRTHAHTHADRHRHTPPRSPVYVVIMVLRVMAVTCCL